MGRSSRLAPAACAGRKAAPSRSALGCGAPPRLTLDPVAFLGRMLTTRPRAASLWRDPTTARVRAARGGANDCCRAVCVRQATAAARPRIAAAVCSACGHVGTARTCAGPPTPAARTAAPHPCPLISVQCASSPSTAATRARCTTPSACSACLRCASRGMAPTSSQVGAAGMFVLLVALVVYLF